MNYRIANVLIFLVIFISVSLLSFRSDYLFNSDHGFHLSYFIQPIISMNEGYRLLVDQPSQYGFMNILIPYLIDFNGPINSFHIFQGLLNIFVIIIVVILSIFILKIKQFNFFIFLFSIILLLSSTDLYGPQVYPSTGVVRFFPVYLVILAQCYIRNINSSFLCEVLCLSLCVFISLLWGAEALFYTLFSIAFYYLQDLLFNPSWEKFKERLYKGLIILGLSISCAFIILKIYQYGFEIESLNIELTNVNKKILFSSVVPSVYLKLKKVFKIKEGIPHSKKIISSKYPVIAVIEIPRNCSKKIDLKVGDKLYWNELMIKDIKFNHKKKYNYACLN